jgi:hypothetical protein
MRSTGISMMALAMLAALGLVRPVGGAVVTGPEAAQTGRFTVTRESTTTHTLRFAGFGERTAVVRLVSGSITVRPSDAAQVELEARRHIRAASDAAAAEAEREVALDVAGDAAMIGAVAREPHGQVCGEPNDGRRGWTWRPAYAVRFDVAARVPRGTRLALCTVNGGDIVVEGTTGDFQVDNVNGRIVMTGIRGSGYAATVNGAVTVSFAEAPRGASQFKTVNGDISITFPTSLSAVLAMKTFNGGLFTDFDVEPLADPRPIAGERRGGATIYRSNQSTRVRVGAGGPEMLFDTFNGDVRIMRATR